jgi:hypothetical protein
MQADGSYLIDVVARLTPVAAPLREACEERALQGALARRLIIHDQEDAGEGLLSAPELLRSGQ